MSGKSNAKFFTKKLYATTAIAASVFSLSTPAHAGGSFTTTIPPQPVIIIKPIDPIIPVVRVTPPVVTGTFVSGSGSFTQDPNKTTITVGTQKSIIDFKNYNIGNGQEVHYQTTTGGTADNLSRVTGGNESQILGSLTSNGVNVYLINPNGVFFGKNATVNVSSLVVSTSDITNENFAKGNLNFNIKGNPNAKITNNGTITVSEAGLAALVAPTVENNGLIVAKNGKVALAAGDQFTVDMYGDDLIKFAVSDSTHQHLVKQSGTISAAGGTVLLTAQDANKVVNNVVNLDGVVEANSVKIHGDQIVLGDAAVINTSSANSGGKVSIQSKNTYISKKAKIQSDALVNGNGGDVSIQADNILALNGNISAKGAGTGKGGTVETTAKQIAFGDGLSITTLDANGGAGTWTANLEDLLVDDKFLPLTNHISNTLLSDLLGTNNITIATSAAGNININNDIFKIDGTDRTLTLNANNINLAKGVSIASDSDTLNLNLNATNDVNINGFIETNGGNFAATGKDFNLANTGSIDVTSDQSVVFDQRKIGNIKLGNVSVNVVKDINVNGTINSDKGLSLISTDGGNININNTITAGGRLLYVGPMLDTIGYQPFTISSVGTTNISTHGGTVNVNSNINSNNVNIVADNKGQINLGAAINAGNLTGNTATVDVTNPNGIINQAVTLVNDGGTINLAAGTYDQNVLINKNLVLNGAGSGQTKITGSSSSNSFKDFYDATVNDAIILVQNANADINNLTVDGTAKIAAAGHRVVGIGFDHAGGSVTFSTVQNTDSGIVAQNNTPLRFEAPIVDFIQRTLNVTSSTVQNFASNGILANGNLLNANLGGNGGNFISGSNTSKIGALIGRGATGQVGNTTFLGFGAAGANEISLFNAGNGVNVHDNDLSYGHANTTGISITGGGFEQVSNNTIKGNDTGISITNSDNALIGSDNVSGNNTGIAINNSQNAIINNSMLDGNGDGVVLNSSSNALIQSSKINNSTDEGVIANSSNGLTINGDTFVNNKYAAIDLETSDNATVKGNTTITGGADGIYAVSSNGLNVSDTEVSSTTEFGIYLGQSSNAVLNNVSVHNNYYGILASNSNALHVTNSKFNYNTYGIEGYQSNDMNVATSTFTGNSDGLYLSHSNGATIDTDEFAGNSVGVILSSSSNALVENSNFHDNSAGLDATPDSFLPTPTGSDNLIVTGSTFTNNATGIELYGSVNAKINNTTISKSGNGLVMYSGAQATLDGDSFADNLNGIYMYSIFGKGNNLTIGNTKINGGTTGLLVDGTNSKVAFTGTTNQFNGQSGQYITLQNGGLNGQQLSVKNVTFDGIVANDATSDSNSFKIEDKIHHEMDINGVGLVTWKDNNVYATLNNLGIQQGVNVSNAGGTVNIAAGTYIENVDIAKGITLNGRGKGNDATVDTIINGGGNTAVNVHAGNQAVSLGNLTVTTNGAQYAVLVDGMEAQTLQSGVIIGGQFVPNGPLIVVGPSTPGAIDFSMDNVLFSGTQTNAALQFQNGTTMGGSTASGVEFRSTAPNGWQFVNIVGQPAKNVFSSIGDMSFGDTVFQQSYNVADIHLVNSTMDGNATGVTFEGDSTPFEIENSVIHVVDNSRLGTIFYNGYDLVQAASNLGSFADELSQDVNDVYYNSVSSAGRIYDTPSLQSARVKTYNPTNDTKVSISAASPSVINLPTASAAQVAGLAPASGNSQQQLSKAAGANELQIASGGGKLTNGNPISLNNLETASGGKQNSNGSAVSLNQLETGSGGLPRQLAANCSVSFGNSFLADSVSAVSGACQ